MGVWTLKRFAVIISLFVFLLSYLGIASASILSDPVFESATTNLKATKNASFYAVTSSEQNSIKITRVRLYKLNSNGTWSYIRDLPIPTNEATNTVLFGAMKDYSSYIGTGTYRLYTTFCADGHYISRYSNTKTY